MPPAQAEIVGPVSVAIEALDRGAHSLARIGERQSDLAVLEGAVRRLEDRGTGFLSCGRGRRSAQERQREDPTPRSYAPWLSP